MKNKNMETIKNGFEKKDLSNIKVGNKYLDNPEEMKKGDAKYLINYSVKPTQKEIVKEVKTIENYAYNLHLNNTPTVKEENKVEETITTVPLIKREKPKSELRKKMEELDAQGLNFSRDFKGTNMGNMRSGVNLLKEEIENDKKLNVEKEINSVKPEEITTTEEVIETPTEVVKPIEEIKKEEKSENILEVEKQDISREEKLNNYQKLVDDYYNYSDKARQVRNTFDKNNKDFGSENLSTVQNKKDWDASHDNYMKISEKLAEMSSSEKDPEILNLFRNIGNKTTRFESSEDKKPEVETVISLKEEIVETPIETTNIIEEQEKNEVPTEVVQTVEQIKEEKIETPIETVKEEIKENPVEMEKLVEEIKKIEIIKDDSVKADSRVDTEVEKTVETIKPVEEIKEEKIENIPVVKLEEEKQQQEDIKVEIHKELPSLDKNIVDENISNIHVERPISVENINDSKKNVESIIPENKEENFNGKEYKDLKTTEEQEKEKRLFFKVKEEFSNSISQLSGIVESPLNSLNHFDNKEEFIEKLSYTKNSLVNEVRDRFKNVSARKSDRLQDFDDLYKTSNLLKDISHNLSLLASSIPEDEIGYDDKGNTLPYFYILKGFIDQVDNLSSLCMRRRSTLEKLL